MNYEAGPVATKGEYVGYIEGDKTIKCRVMDVSQPVPGLYEYRLEDVEHGLVDGYPFTYTVLSSSIHAWEEC